MKKKNFILYEIRDDRGRSLRREYWTKICETDDLKEAEFRAHKKIKLNGKLEFLLIERSTDTRWLLFHSTKLELPPREIAMEEFAKTRRWMEWEEKKDAKRMKRWAQKEKGGDVVDKKGRTNVLILKKQKQSVLWSLDDFGYLEADDKRKRKLLLRQVQEAAASRHTEFKVMELDFRNNTMKLKFHLKALTMHEYNAFKELGKGKAEAE